MDSVIQISASGAAVLVVGLFGLVFGFGLVLLRQFESRVSARDSALAETAQAERQARASEMRDLRGTLALESRRIGTMSDQLGELLDLDKRLRVLEEWRSHVPTDDDIAAIQTALAAVQERADNTLTAVRRIEAYLMETR